MAAPGERRVTEDQIRAWKGSGHPYKLIAAAIAEWAAGQERGTVLPDDGFFGIEASVSSYQRARTFLVAQGVLKAHGGAGYVALPARPAPSLGRASPAMTSPESRGSAACPPEADGEPAPVPVSAPGSALPLRPQPARVAAGRWAPADPEVLRRVRAALARL